MAAHRREQIRSLIVARIQQANTTLADRVYSGRIQPALEEEVWAGGIAIVYTGKESSKPEDYPPSHHQAGLRRDLDIEVQLYASAFNDPDPSTATFDGDAFVQIDKLSREVEDALETYDPPGFGSSLLRLMDSTPEVIPADARGMPLCKMTMRYVMTYTTPYRECSDPLVRNDAEDVIFRGYYPGGQVVEGCPAEFTGEVCPVPGASAIGIGGPEPGTDPIVLPTQEQASRIPQAVATPAGLSVTLLS